MRVQLSDQRWDEVLGGQLTAPDSRRFSRRTTRTKRREGDDPIAAGAPLVLYYWAGGQLEWFDAADAAQQWRAVRVHVTSQEPRPTGDVEWTVGRWEDERGQPLLLLTGHC
ncbi:hypothetical protein SAMN05661080_04287 [Modestobacter sp. DSM 44400]|uniref:hypothetical protein n=1 Tax=Modestobacter sp. DSM 44400 TaxID=1550230 RepID=UPI000895DD94|nr:hypothetical protein [Modestobacter sp. DSM 44400]SDY68682.1 hypothetical protein SAMN05661080_04287 [Modestobacter sp. DSM 44400]